MSIAAFVSFNGHSLQIITSFNVDNVTRINDEAGRYTVVFKTPMQTPEYCATISARKWDANNDANVVTALGCENGVMSKSSCPVTVCSTSGEGINSKLVCLVVYEPPSSVLKGGS